MNYVPIHAVWEITYACNMRCKHCGSGCGETIPFELTTDEAISLCDDLAALGLRVLTLSGGEPFMRRDWHLLAARLAARGVTTNVISNGWFVNEELVRKAADAGIVNMAVSIDGLEKTHDHMRMKGSFARALGSLDAMSKAGMSSVVCTNVNKRNLPELRELRSIIAGKKVRQWQLQITRPMGNFADSLDEVIGAEELCSLVDFAYETMLEGNIEVNIGDDIGYFGIKDSEIRRRYASGSDPIRSWAGCQAGKGVLGIRANGDISGCLSIRDESFIEGNVRTTSLADIWRRPGGFAWNREASKAGLTGFCGTCQYAECCLAGCAGSRLYLSNTLSENIYCVYRIIIEREARKIRQIDKIDECLRCAGLCIEKKSYQLADLFFARSLELKPGDPYIIDMLGFVNFYLTNYEKAKEYNKRALRINPGDAYAQKGLGLCYTRLGEVAKGIELILKAIRLAGDDSADYYMDLAIVLDENDRTGEAIRVLDEVGRSSPKFRGTSNDLREYLVSKSP